jgi:glyoxylase-like metal-dependent hydrolase (beta-lactamase superfamily II)
MAAPSPPSVPRLGSRIGEDGTVIPTRPAQYDDAMADRMTAADEVADGVWSIPVRMPDPRNPYTLCYVLEGEDGSLHVLDPGMDSDENWMLLTTGLAGFGLRLDQVAGVGITHLHPDHLGMAERLRTATGAPVAMLRREQEAAIHLAEHGGDLESQFDAWGVPQERRGEIRHVGRIGGAEVALVADVLWSDGDHWAVAGRSVEVVATPGHTPGHACLVDPTAGVVFSGDHVLPKIYPGLGLGGPTPTNPIADYRRSLDRIAAFDELEVAPGHGYRFRGLRERCDEIRGHHLARSREAARVIAEHPSATVYEVAAQLPWTAGWSHIRGFVLYSALSQTEQHLGFVGSSDFTELG